MLGSVVQTSDNSIEKRKAYIPAVVELTFLWGGAQIISKINKTYSILDSDKYLSREGLEIWVRKA